MDTNGDANFDVVVSEIAQLCTIDRVLRSTRILVIEADEATAAEVRKVTGVCTVKPDTWKPPNRRPPNVRG